MATASVPVSTPTKTSRRCHSTAVALLKDVIQLRQQIDEHIDVLTGKQTATAPHVPALLATMVRNMQPDATRLLEDLAIVCRMMPALIDSVTAGTYQAAGTIDVFTIIEALRHAFESDTASELHREQMAEIRQALAAAGRDVEQDMADVRLEAAHEGFLVGVAYAYFMLRERRA